jgi:hypothetical protein
VNRGGRRRITPQASLVDQPSGICWPNEKKGSQTLFSYYHPAQDLSYSLLRPVILRRGKKRRKKQKREKLRVFYHTHTHTHKEREIDEEEEEGKKDMKHER